MDQVKTVSKWIKKIKTPSRRRVSQDSNQTFPSSSTSLTKRGIKSRSKAFRGRQSKNSLYDIDSDLHNTRVQEKKTIKQFLKEFLSPGKNNSSERKNKSIKQSNEDSKSSQASEFKQIVNISMSSLLGVGNFSTSSPVYSRKTFYKQTQDLKEFDNKLFIYSENQNIETHNYSDAGVQAQDDDSNSAEESPTTLTDLVRSSSDSEIHHSVGSRNSDEQSGEFTRNDISRHSYPGPCNSARRESCQRMLRCMLENMAANMIEDQYNNSTITEDDTLDSEIQRCFDNFDESISPDDSFAPKKTMRETLLEISERRKSLMNKEKVFCPMKSPTKKNNGNYWKLKRASDMSNWIPPRGFDIHTMNITEEKEDQLNKETEKEIIKNDVSFDCDHSVPTPPRRACFENSYIYNSNNSLVISTWI